MELSRFYHGSANPTSPKGEIARSNFPRAVGTNPGRPLSLDYFLFADKD